MKKITLWLTFLVAFVTGSYGQAVGTYSFSQSVGTYTPITGGTVLASLTGLGTGAAKMDDAVYNIPNGTIPFNFTFAGTNYTGCNVNSNGYITFGATAPSTSSYTPLSSTTAYEGAISAFGRDLEGGFVLVADRTTGSNTLLNASNLGPLQVGDFITGTGIPAATTVTAIAGSTITMSANSTSTGVGGAVHVGGASSNIQYVTEGSAPNRVFVIQYSNFKRFGTTLGTVQHMSLNFQIRLYETTNEIKVVYNNCSPGLTTFTTVNQVGLRGINNTYPTNVNNRMNTKATNDDWVNSANGASNTSGMLFNNVAPANVIANGLTYTWTIPSCIAPTVSVANVTASSADLSWTTTSGNYQYVLDQVITDPAGAGTATTATTFNPTGLSASTTYYMHVRTDCGGSFSTWSTRSFTTLMANDNFSGALPVTCGNTYTGTTATATLDEDSAPDGFGADMDAPNVWYSYTGSGTPETITLNLCGSSYDSSVLIYTGTSGALTLIGGNDDDDTCGAGSTRSYATFTSNGTTTYYIAIEGWNSTSTGAFSMAVTCAPACTPAVANQACATSLSVSVNGVDVNSDNSCGDVAAVQPSCDSFGTIQDVWFSFVAPTSGNVSCLVTPTTMTSGNFRILEGADCASLTERTGTCNSNFTTGTTEVLTGLTGGATYYVQVWSSGAEQGTFSINLSEPCVNPSGITASNVTMSSADLTWAVVSPSNYEYELDMDNTVPASGTTISGEAYSASGLADNTVYYFHVRRDCGAGNYSAWVTYSFTTLATPPANDDCAGAITLTPAVDFASGAITATLLGATDSEDADPSIPAPGCAAYIGHDVWFTVTVPSSGSINLETGGAPASAVGDTGMAVYSGTCGGLVLADCDDFSSSNTGDHALITLDGTTSPAVNPNDVLYVRVWRYNSTSASRDINAVGEFQVAAWDPALSTGSFDLNGFKAYPNPVKDIFKVSYTKNISNVSVTNLVGQEVMSKKVNALQSDVDMSALASGTYLVKITSEGLTKTIKVIKE